VAQVTALGDPIEKKPRRLGFLTEKIRVPDDFDTMGQEEIERLFFGEDQGCFSTPM
jgi:hypothetical protein